jgi:hypothetical protein
MMFHSHSPAELELTNNEAMGASRWVEQAKSTGNWSFKALSPHQVSFQKRSRSPNQPQTQYAASNPPTLS